MNDGGLAGVTRLRPMWWVAAGVALVAASLLGIALGPVQLSFVEVARDLLDRLPGIAMESGLDERERAIVWEIRLPRVFLGLLVGSMLAISGAAYQGVFRNPLADPYLLGAAAGAGLAVTFAIITFSGTGRAPGLLPIAAFAGAVGAVILTTMVGGGVRGGPASLILAGVAVASFLTAIQTFLQQQHVDTIRDVYSWILGRLTTAGWGEVRSAAPYAVVSGTVLLTQRRLLDVLALGDDEAMSLGVDPRRVRAIVVGAATLATAAAVSVSGLIGFVGIIVPHTLRLLAGRSYRAIVPLSLLFGAAFLATADIAARLALAPAEIPIGVITAFLGGPFFVLVLRTSRTSLG